MVISGMALSSTQLVTIRESGRLKVVGSNGKGEKVDKGTPLAFQGVTTRVNLRLRRQTKHKVG